MGFAAWTLAQALRRTSPEDRALGVAGAASLGLLAIAGFPFETALIIYPWLLFLSGFLGRRHAAQEVIAPAVAEPRNAPTPDRARRRKR